MTPARQRFESLDALRGVAALAIACFHFPAAFIGSDVPILRHAYILTNLFFALSGFIIMAVYGDKLASGPAFRSFAWTRLSRLMPLHLATSVTILAAPYLAYLSRLVWTWLFTGTYAGALPSFPIDWHAYMIHVGLLQGFGLLPELVYNFPAWSMGALFMCSLLLAAVTTFARPVRLPVFIALVAGAFYLLAFKSPYYAGASHDYGFARAVYSYFAGALTFMAWQRWTPGEAVRRWAPLLQTCSLVVLLGYMTVVGVDNPKSLLAPLVVTVFMWSFAMDNGDYARFLSHPAFKWLAARSYSIFMNQALLLFMGHQATGWSRRLGLDPFQGSLMATATLAVYMALLLMMSDWTYRHIELRFRPATRPASAPAGATPA